MRIAQNRVLEQSIAQQVTAKYDVSGQIDSEKVPAWMAGAARLTGSVSFATTEERITVTGDKYVVESTATGAAFLSKFFDNLRVVRRSEGSWVGGAQATTRFFEKRGSSEPATVVIDYRAGTARLSRGPGSPTKVEPIKFMTSDTAALPFVFLGRPRPSGPATCIPDGRLLRTMTLDSTVVFEHRVAGKPVPRRGTSAAAAVYNAANLTITPNQVPAESRVRYKTDATGQVSQIWLLPPER